MKRRRVVRRDDRITLFPFLAVLICTMGSLIVLLVVVVQQAKATAEKTTQHRTDAIQHREQEIEQIENKRQEFEWRIDILKNSRVQLMEQRDNRQAELSHLENEIHELTEQLNAAIAEEQQITLLENRHAADQFDSQQRVDELRDALRRAEADLEAARDSMDGRQRSYSIVPYEGPHGTQRRPLFVECLADRVVIQPEGIELTERDFIQPLTDSNPLAVALRAKREYLSNAFRASDGQPYPLLIVRPEDAKSYAAARAAMKSWDAEFGYELVGEDIQLNYPASDPAMAERIRQAVALSRERRRRLQAIAPARFGRVGSTALRASRTGGFVGGEDTRVESGSGSGRPGSQVGYTNGRDQNVTPTGQRHLGGNGFGTADQQSDDHEFAEFSPQGGNFNQRTNGTSVAAAADDHSNGTGRSGLASRGDQTDREMADDRFSNSPNEGPDRTASDPAAGSQRTAGQGTPPGSTNSSSAAGTTASSGSPSGSGSPLDSAGNSASVSIQTPGSGLGATSGSTPPSALADTRGRNWGLPDGGGATGITRPIPLIISPNRLDLPSEGRNRLDRVRMPIQGSMRDEIDTLVPQVWKRMEGWGIAGPNMYWKPVLSVRVEPGAEARYQELQALLRNSGIVVEQKR